MEIIPVASGVRDRKGLFAQGPQLCSLKGGNSRSQTHSSHLASRWVLILIHKIGETRLLQGKD